MKQISILMGSESDVETVNETVSILKEFRIDFEVRVLSAHRTPHELSRYVTAAPRRGVKLFIAAAGMSAALAGVIAAHTTLPVIGIPIEGKVLKGWDALLSTVQMPPGVPVACMAIGRAGAKNAALFAIEILALNNAKLAGQLKDYKKKMRVKIKQIKVKL